MNHIRPASPSRAFRRLPLLFLATLALLSCDLFDIFPPEIEIVSPIDGASCVGTLSCDIDATDNRGVVKVELFLDNASIHEFTDTPYKANLDISGQSAGTKTFKATAYDQAGNHAEDERQVRIEKESISTPTTPTGPGSGYVDTLYIFSTGGSTSNAGNSLQYSFDWGDGNISNWYFSSSASHSWNSSGNYNVKAQARCAIHTEAVSSWSSSKKVIIEGEVISIPDIPVGPDSGFVNFSNIFSTGDAVSSFGHSVEYRFDWGDGNYSAWTISSSISHSWSSSGTYNVKAQARCATDTSVVSSWSSARTVTIEEWSPTLAGTYNTPGYARDVFISGSYAYVADAGSGLQVINVADPAGPTLAGSYDTPYNAQGVFVSGNYAYVACYILQVIDVSIHASPTLAGSCDTPNPVCGVFVSGSHAYVAASTGGLDVINVPNPASPTLVGNCDTPGRAFGVFVSSSYAYVADDDRGLQIINVSNPASPTLAGTYDTPGYYAVDVFVSGSYAYVADGGSGLQIIDVSNPTNPTLAGSYNTPDMAKGVFVSGGYAYVADSDSGLQIINVSNPASPTLAGSYDTLGDACGVFVAGGYAYVADYESGLLIFDVSGLP